MIATFIKKNYNNIYIVGIDNKKIAKIFHTNYIDSFLLLSSESGYIESICKIIKDEHIDIFIPTHSDEMDKVLENRTLLGSALEYFGSYKDFQTLNNKLLLQELCLEIGIKNPKSYDSLTYENIPFIVKPSQSAASKGMMYVFDKNSFNKMQSVYQNPTAIVIQEYIEGVGVGYSVFAKGGEIIVGYGHKRLAEYPISGGSSVYREEYMDDRMKEMATTIVSHLNWSGFAMFEFKLTKDGELYLIEVNPRIWGSINQGLANGCDYFSGLLESTVLKENEKSVNTYLSPLIYVALLKYMLRFNVKPLIRFIKNIFSNKSDISILNDTRGWLGVLLRTIS